MKADYSDAECLSTRSRKGLDGPSRRSAKQQDDRSNV